MTAYNWISGKNGNWSDHTNWTPDGVPGANDSATITDAPALPSVVIVDSQITVSQVKLYSNYGTGAILQDNGKGWSITVDDLTLGPGFAVIGVTLDVLTSLTIEGTSVGGNVYCTFDGGKLINEGLGVVAADSQSGVLAINQFVLLNKPNATLDLQGDIVIGNRDPAAKPNTFATLTNNGTLTKTKGDPTHSADIWMGIESSGNVSLLAGNLRFGMPLGATGNASGSFSNVNGSFFSFNGAFTFTPSSVIDAAGSVGFNDWGLNNNPILVQGTYSAGATTVGSGYPTTFSGHVISFGLPFKIYTSTVIIISPQFIQS